MIMCGWKELQIQWQQSFSSNVIVWLFAIANVY